MGWVPRIREYSSKELAARVGHQGHNPRLSTICRLDDGSLHTNVNYVCVYWIECDAVNRIVNRNSVSVQINACPRKSAVSRKGEQRLKQQAFTPEPHCVMFSWVLGKNITAYPPGGRYPVPVGPKVRGEAYPITPPRGCMSGKQQTCAIVCRW